MERDQNNHADNVHDEKVDHKIGRDFRNLGPHGMVHLHSGIEHLSNVDVEVGFFTYSFHLVFSHSVLYLLLFLCMSC